MRYNLKFRKLTFYCLTRPQSIRKSKQISGQKILKSPQVWSPIRSVIIHVRVIDKIRQPWGVGQISLIMNMITDWIGQHEALLPINN